MIAIELLLTNGQVACWENVWNLLNSDGQFGTEAIEYAVHRLSNTFRDSLSEKELADLFIWLSEKYPQSSDPVHQGSYAVTARDEIVSLRQGVLNTLIDRGTEDAVIEISRIESCFPELEYLKFVRLDAIGKQHEESWQALSVDELKKMLAERLTRNKVTVLFLAANPKTTSRLALDEEIRAIEAKIRASEYRESLKLEARWAVRPDDLLQAMNEINPTIVHFSGHGMINGELVLTDEQGCSKTVELDGVAKLIEHAGPNVRIVLFNSCFSAAQAKEVLQHVEAAIGMSDSIGDEAARIFASHFYSAIGFGHSIGTAFEQGKTALVLSGLREEDIPTLLIRPGLEADKIVLVS